MTSRVAALALRLTLAWLLLLPALAQAQWFSSGGSSGRDFLPVHEAFEASAWLDDDTLYVGMQSADDYYLYRHRFEIESLDDDVTLGEPLIPPGEAHSDEFFGDVYVFYQPVVLEIPLENGSPESLAFALTFQGCADAGLCYPPERITLEAMPGSPPGVFANALADGSEPSTTTTAAPSLQSADGRFNALLAEASPLLMVGLFFLAGLGLTFTPCVLPMVPILSSIIVGQNPSRGRAFVLSASYVAGMAATYAAVGVLMGLFGAGLNLQARLQSAPVLIGFSALFVIFALAMLGAFNLRLSPALAGRIDAWQAHAQRSGPPGLALAGALSVLVVSPCVSAPLAGALVFISTTGDALLGGAALLALALGMGIPLLLVGTFGTTLMPRTGAWMNGVKIAFGILLLGVAIWLIERLLPPAVALLLWSALAIGTALTLGALRLGAPRGWPQLRQAAGLMLLIWGIALVIGAARGAQDPLRPLAVPPGVLAERGGAELPTPVSVTRLEDLQLALADASRDGRPVFVDVTADWCISCKQMERNVYPSVAGQLANFQRIQIDVTETTDASRELLDHFGLFGPPSLLFFDGEHEIREARILGEVGRRDFAQHLEQLIGWLEQQHAATT
ncbi:protein-disulfide reductase DsbD [Franzmannia qiaohouensis]|uniref:Protein-disulfide reductase DsbD n=1 Tax=Franzmannia qiaohouensis TaxID=1329370 RepID=A0ABU1HJ49_9GAMM|nr:protein-disulfide reductase DsbD [Halomonas qiaohouensis]MDR5907316.1 protein-disulfide reductase DsbD [Halomonas qiaohouensis]